MALVEIHDRYAERFGASGAVEEALRHIDREAASRRLTQAVVDADPSERAALCRVLGWLGGRSAIESLVALLDAEPDAAASCRHGARRTGARRRARPSERAARERQRSPTAPASDRGAPQYGHGGHHRVPRRSEPERALARVRCPRSHRRREGDRRALLAPQRSGRACVSGGGRRHPGHRRRGGRTPGDRSGTVARRAHPSSGASNLGLLRITVDPWTSFSTR